MQENSWNEHIYQKDDQEHFQNDEEELQKKKKMLSYCYYDQMIVKMKMMLSEE